MSKLVWTENSLDSISLHLVQAYVIRSHRYKTANGPWKQCQQYIKGCRDHLCHLPGLGQVGHSPQGEPLGVLGPWTWAQWGWSPSSLVTNYLTNLKSDRLTFVHVAGWLANCSWLADWLSNKMSTCPCPQVEISCSQVCCYFGHVDLWSDVSPWADTLWPSVILLQVKLTFGPTFGQITPHGLKHLVAKCDTISGQVDLFIEG